MPPGNRRSRSNGAKRLQAAKNALQSLSSVLQENLISNPDLSDNAARHILSIGKKHGTRPGPNISRMICRKCKKSMAPGRTSRIRLASKKITTTCLRCGRITREGPDFGCKLDA